MFRKLIITAIIILTYYVNVNSQCTQEWVARYNGPPSVNDYANAIVTDDSGNVYVTGYSLGSGTNYDYASIKYNSSGDSLWVRRYNGPGNGIDQASSIAVDDAGNVYVTGYSTGSGSGLDYATIKYNSTGVQLWVQLYNGTGNANDNATSVAIDAGGNVYVTGNSIGGTNSDYATIKYNSSGVQQWVQRYNGPGNNAETASKITVDVIGNVYVTGYSIVSGINYDYATIKYNAAGDSLWVRRYNGPGNGSDYANSIAVDGECNVYVTGYSMGSGTSSDYATIKYDSTGVQLWVQRYNGPTNSEDRATSVVFDTTSNVYVTGYSYGSGTNTDFATIKYNSSGVQQWVQRFNGPENNADGASSLAVDGAGNVYVTGYRLVSGISNYDYVTLKYTSSGVQQWVQSYNGPGNGEDKATSIAIDGAGNVYVTGGSSGSGIGNYDYATIKYSSPTGLPQNNELPTSYLLYQNYPNPFNPSTTIKFDIPKAQFVKITVFDILGREISKLVDEFRQAGIHEVQFDAWGLSSGIYIVKLKTNDYSDIKKIILIK